MAACLNCGRFVYMDIYCADEKVFCSSDCKKRYEIRTITLNKPCSVCLQPIIISEGFIVSKKQVYCSDMCFNQSNINI